MLIYGVEYVVYRRPRGTSGEEVTDVAHLPSIVRDFIRDSVEVGAEGGVVECGVEVFRFCRAAPRPPV